MQNFSFATASIDYQSVNEVDARLKQHYGAAAERELLDALGSDFYYMPVRDISQNEGFMKYYKKSLALTEKERECPLGIRWRRAVYESKFAVDETIKGPLENARTPQDILNHQFPRAADFDFTPLLEYAEQMVFRE